MVRFYPLNEEKKDGYRVKREGPIHFVFRGSEHIGNILAPQLGGDKTNASKFTALAKHWGKKSTHPSKHSAMNWLKNSHSLTVRLEDVEIIMGTLNESEEHKERLMGMDNSALKEYFRTLYQQHVKNGMAPKHFKSPQHLATIIERQHGLPKGTYSNKVHENLVYVVRKGSTPSIDRDQLARTFLNVYNEAIAKMDPDNVSDQDNDDKLSKKGVKTKNIDGSTKEVTLPKTMTGEPGTVVDINPMLKQPTDTPDAKNINSK